MHVMLCFLTGENKSYIIRVLYIPNLNQDVKKARANVKAECFDKPQPQFLIFSLRHFFVVSKGLNQKTPKLLSNRLYLSLVTFCRWDMPYLKCALKTHKGLFQTIQATLFRNVYITQVHSSAIVVS